MVSAQLSSVQFSSGQVSSAQLISSPPTASPRNCSQLLPTAPLPNLDPLSYLPSPTAHRPHPISTSSIGQANYAHVKWAAIGWCAYNRRKTWLIQQGSDGRSAQTLIERTPGKQAIT